MSPGKHYRPVGPDVWRGRVDDTEDRLSFRWHQVVRPLDISREQLEIETQGGQSFCFLGFCCDEGVKRNLGRVGSSKAPLSIRREMSNLPVRFPETTTLYDAGDILCPKNDLESSLEHLSLAVKRILSLGLFPIVLGGGHEVAVGHFNGILDSMSEGSKDVGIVNFDAHFDLRPYKDGGSSGSSFNQIAETCRKESIDFAYYCVGVQKYANTVSLFDRADTLGAGYILAQDITESKLGLSAKLIDEFVGKHENIYLTICADVFSSAFAPGVSAPQPFGLHPELVLSLVKQVVRSGKVLSMDIAEVSPRFDDDNQTSKLAAVIIFAVINALLFPDDRESM